MREENCGEQRFFEVWSRQVFQSFFARIAMISQSINPQSTDFAYHIPIVAGATHCAAVTSHFALIHWRSRDNWKLPPRVLGSFPCFANAQSQCPMKDLLQSTMESPMVVSLAHESRFRVAWKELRATIGVEAWKVNLVWRLTMFVELMLSLDMCVLFLAAVCGVLEQSGNVKSEDARTLVS